jgi:prepilin-type N-terminal cleavage/methylation domain-containing protein
MDSLKFLRSHRGFTLIEIAAVLVIIAILSTLAVKHMGGSGISLYGDADQLVADLRYAQSLAMTRAPDESGGYNGKVTITTTEDGDGWNLNGGFSFPDGENSRTPSGLAVTPDISITFEYPKGSVDKGADTDIVLTRGTKTITITRVYDETGYVEMFRHSFHTIFLGEGLRFGTSGWSSSFLSGSYTGSSPNILIPASMDGVTLTRVWQDVFNDKGLDSISFQNESQIEHIHARAFRNNNLTEVVLPETLKRIDQLAFDGNNITSVVIPDSVTTIERSAFTSLEKITVGSNLNFHSHPQGHESLLNDSINGNNAFRDAYVAEGGGEGTYTWNGSTWLKE